MDQEQEQKMRKIDGQLNKKKRGRERQIVPKNIKVSEEEKENKRVRRKMRKISR